MSPEVAEHAESSVLPKSFSGGPHGLGDPSDRRLRKVEVEVLIPQKMRNKAREEKCADLVLKFGECSKREGLMLPFMCRKENDALKACLKKWYEDPDFQHICREEYLNERSNFRETGVWRKKDKRAEIRRRLPLVAFTFSITFACDSEDRLL
ncbi:COX assembly mitochondrial protein homolog isoform X2 [Dermacentor andersoni]|uniref:COX assembly mitochondrial protein homolog isoform X2 n=1 Tax=Dermacentor andersoni TaxID=34620 RepID=UPI003B3AF8EF